MLFFFRVLGALRLLRSSPKWELKLVDEHPQSLQYQPKDAWIIHHLSHTGAQITFSKWSTADVCDLRDRLMGSLFVIWTTDRNLQRFWTMVSWCVLMFLDVSWCFLVFLGVSWCFLYVFPQSRLSSNTSARWIHLNIPGHILNVKVHNFKSHFRCQKWDALSGIRPYCWGWEAGNSHVSHVTT